MFLKVGSSASHVFVFFLRSHCGRSCPALRPQSQTPDTQTSNRADCCGRRETLAKIFRVLFSLAWGNLSSQASLFLCGFGLWQEKREIWENLLEDFPVCMSTGNWCFLFCLLCFLSDLCLHLFPSLSSNHQWITEP